MVKTGISFSNLFFSNLIKALIAGIFIKIIYLKTVSRKGARYVVSLHKENDVDISSQIRRGGNSFF